MKDVAEFMFENYYQQVGFNKSGRKNSDEK